MQKNIIPKNMENKNNQSVVQYLQSQIDDHLSDGQREHFEIFFNQANLMHKEQVINDYLHGFKEKYQQSKFGQLLIKQAEEYYYNTYVNNTCQDAANASSASFISNSGITKSAVISNCQKYRYSLTRVWDDNKERVLFIMLNPSTADANTDDPTIRRCIGFAKDWGYGGIYVINLFALRATNPKELLNAPDVVGDENEKWFKRMSALAHLVVCAWGNGDIVDKLLKQLNHAWKPLTHISKPLHYIQLSNDGIPKHPLYLPKNLTPKPYEISPVSLSENIIHVHHK